MNGWLVYIGCIVISFVWLLLASKYYSNRKAIFLDGIIQDTEKAYIKELIQYFVWAGIQQALVITLYIILQKYVGLNNQFALIVSVMVFVSLHYPNIILMFAVGFMEMVLLTLWPIYQNVVMMALTHAILATTLYIYYPEYYTRGFQVLWWYWNKYQKLK